MSQEVTREFMVGTWRNKDQLTRWGITDRTRATLGPMPGASVMTLKEDGGGGDRDLFVSAAGRWEIGGQGLVIYDPERPETASRLIPIRKRRRRPDMALGPLCRRGHGNRHGAGVERQSLGWAQGP